jgi:outer membrane protein
LLPNVVLTGSNSRNRSDVDFGRDVPARDRNIRSWNWTLQLTQPILRKPNDHAHDEAESLAEQLALAQRGFEKGAATITDTHEARSRVKLAHAERVAALNERESRRSELEKIVDEAPETWGDLFVLRPRAVTPKLQPEEAHAWIDQARANHPLARVQEAALQAAEAAVSKNRAEHWPTLDLVASHGRSHSSGSLDTPTDYSTAARSNVIDVQLTIPLYAGGATGARIAEALAVRDKTRADLEAARRQAATEARQAFPRPGQRPMWVPGRAAILRG